MMETGTSDVFKDIIFDFVIDDLEGGAQYTNRKDDPGGPTKFGVIQRTLDRLRITFLEFSDLPVDVKDLTRDQACRIARSVFWDALSCDEFHPAVSLYLFDCAYNCGQTNAVALLQTAGCMVGRRTGAVSNVFVSPSLKEFVQHVINVRLSSEKFDLSDDKYNDALQFRIDGGMGPKTKALVFPITPLMMCTEYNAMRLLYYNRIGGSNLHGWHNRLEKVRVMAERLLRR
jgi:lysozyme family protein